MARLSTCALQSEATLAETSVLRSSGVATTTGLFVGEEAGVGGSAVTGWKRPTRLAGGRPAMARPDGSAAVSRNCDRLSAPPPSRPTTQPRQHLRNIPSPEQAGPLYLPRKQIHQVTERQPGAPPE